MLSRALGGTRTPNLLIRSQMLYPLSYERGLQQYMAVSALTVRVRHVRSKLVFRSFLVLSLVRGSRGHAGDEWFVDLGG